MLLADQILAAKSLSPILEDFRPSPADRLRAAIQRAHRFELTEHFTVAADVSIGHNPSGVCTTIDNLLDFARPPFDEVWLECVQSHRPRCAILVPPEHLRKPKRVGILFQLIDKENLVYEATLCWTIENKPGDTEEPEYSPVTVCPVSWFFDYSYGKSEMVKQLSPMKVPDYDQTRREFPNLSEKDLKAAIHLSQLAGHYSLSRYWVQPLEAIYHDGNMQTAKRFIDASLYDWTGEQPFWLVVLAFLAARNIVTTEERPAPERLNKHRLRAHKSPLQSFTVCKIDSRWLVKSGGGDAENRLAVKGHFVRGHFKARRTGLWWWNPFRRGDDRLGTVEKRYEVK